MAREEIFYIGKSVIKNEGKYNEKHGKIIEEHGNGKYKIFWNDDTYSLASGKNLTSLFKINKD